jgi:hypothetical protein
VEQDHTALADLRQPGAEIVADGLVGVEAVDVEEVHAARADPVERLVEGHLEQR